MPGKQAPIVEARLVDAQTKGAALGAAPVMIMRYRAVHAAFFGRVPPYADSRRGERAVYFSTTRSLTTANETSRTAPYFLPSRG
ncbi:hypothetical protein [Paenibacillus glycinis]|uniref:hypothetical protein n=1 Tax=Paenibacillus glycinis TaxID=2697035 RepID=UPI001378E78D|nr:hypothetical protein [Paenibacillus glycinis]